MKNLIWINGKVLEKKNAKISVFDRSFLYGDGLFETMRAYNTRIFRLESHLERLFRGARILKIKIPYKKNLLYNKLTTLTRNLKVRSTYVRIAVTKGAGKMGLGSSLECKPNVIIWVNSFKDHPASYYKKGAKVIISSIRKNSFSPVSSIKSSNYLDNILALSEASKRGKDDAIMLNTEGFISEATTSNVFIIKGNKLITPCRGEGLLPGITRETLIEIAPQAGLRVFEKRLRPRDLMAGDEAFLTNSVVELRGVVGINNVRISDGTVGPRTQELHCIYREFVRGELGIA